MIYEILVIKWLNLLENLIPLGYIKECLHCPEIKIVKYEALFSPKFPYTDSVCVCEREREHFNFKGSDILMLDHPANRSMFQP